MPKVATKTVELAEIGVSLEIPVGSLDPPDELSTQIVRAMYSPKGWKWPTTTFETQDKSLAENVAYCLDWHLGGHEIEERTDSATGKTSYVVSSRGYYHYVGA